MPRGLEEHPSAFEGGLCVTGMSGSVIHTPEGATLAFQGHSGPSARAETRARFQQAAMPVPFSLLNIKNEKRPWACHLRVQKCGDGSCGAHVCKTLRRSLPCLYLVFSTHVGGWNLWP